MKSKTWGAFRTSGRIAMKTWKRMQAADVAVLAESLSFETVLSLVPLLAVSLSVFKAFGGFETLIKQFEPFIISNFVEASGAHVSQFIRDAIARIQSQALGIAGAAGLLYTSTRLYMNVERAVRQVWREEHTRFSFRRVVVFWVVLFFGPLFLAMAIGAIGSRNLGVFKLLPANTLAFFATLFGFVLINRFLPSARVSWRSVFLSSGLAAVGVVLAQTFYASLTSTFLRYSAIYGSIASIPIFLLWVLVLWRICLGGVALCATLEEKEALSDAA